MTVKEIPHTSIPKTAGILSAPKRVAWDGTGYLLIALALLTAYLPSLFSDFGYADDYPILAEVQSASGKWVVSLCSSFGRPIEGISLEWIFGLAKTIENLAYVRAFVIAQLILLAFLIYRHLFRFTASQTFSAMAAIFILTLPPYEFFACSATAVVLPLPALLTFPAYVLISGIKSWRNPNAYLRLGFAAALLVIGLCIYQPTVLFIVFWFMVQLLFTPFDWSTFRHQSVALFCTIGLAGVISVAGMRLLTPANARTQLAHNMTFKAEWFLGKVIPNTFRFHLIESAPSTGIAILVGIFLIIILFSRDKWSNLAMKIALSLIGLPMSYAGSLVTEESFATYRTRAALMPCAAILLVYALWVISCRSPVILKWLGRTAMILVACAGTYFAAFNVYNYIVYPQTLEYALIRSQMGSQDAQRYREIHLIPPDSGDTWLDAYNLDWSFDEFGLLTTARPPDWGMAQSLVRLAFIRVHPAWHDQWSHVTVLPANAKPPDDPSIITIDMTPLIKFK